MERSTGGATAESREASPPSPLPSPSAPPEVYQHDVWLEDLERLQAALGLTNMELEVLRHTHACARFATGETYVSAKGVAFKLEHKGTNRVTETWSKAALLGMMTRPYKKPHGPARHYRRLLPASNWRHAADPDGGRVKSSGDHPNRVIETSGDHPNRVIETSGDHPNRVIETDQIGCALYKDDPDLDLSLSERTNGSDPVVVCSGEGETDRPDPDQAAPAGQLVDDVSRGWDMKTRELTHELERRGVCTADAENFVRSYPREAVQQQLDNFDQARQRREIPSVGGWFRTALEKGFAPSRASAAAPRTPPYAAQNEANAAVRAECRAVEAQRMSTAERWASLSQADRDAILCRAIERDEVEHAEAYRSSKASLRSIIDDYRTRGANPLMNGRVLSVVAELLHGA